MSSRSSTDDDRRDEEVVVGRVRRPHGVRGGLLVEPLSDVPDRFRPGARLVLTTEKGSRPVEVASAARHGEVLRVGLAGYDDRTSVEGLRGAVLSAPRSESPPLPEGAFYYYEVVGCACVDADAGELGEVVEVVEDGGGLLLRVEDGNRGVLVPVARSYVTAIDREARRIDVRLPEGFLESCAYRS